MRVENHFSINRIPKPEERPVTSAPVVFTGNKCDTVSFSGKTEKQEGLLTRILNKLTGKSSESANPVSQKIERNPELQNEMHCVIDRHHTSVVIR